MPHFEKFVQTASGKILMSIILGFGFASLFRQVCDNYNCVQLIAPAINEIQDKIFKIGDKCSTYTYSMVSCPSNSKNIVHFETFKNQKSK